MRSNKLIIIMLFLSVFLTILSVPVFADAETHPPTLIIPTKFMFLLSDMAEDAAKQVSGASTPVPAREAVPNGSPGQVDATGSDEEVLPAGLIPDRSYSGMGRGFVQTNFDVSFEGSDHKVNNHERLTARGLFDVHVVHGFN